MSVCNNNSTSASLLCSEAEQQSLNQLMALYADAHVQPADDEGRDAVLLVSQPSVLYCQLLICTYVLVMTSL